MVSRPTAPSDPDGPRLLEQLGRRANALLEAHDLAGWSDLFAEAAAEPDRHLRYAARRTLVESAVVHPSGTRSQLAERLAQLAAVLVVLLEEEPREPVLLNHAGVAFYELGALDPAEALFGAARGLDPGLRHVASNLAEIRRRRSQGLTELPGLPVPVVEVLGALAPRAAQIAAAAQPAEGMTLSLCMIVKNEEAILERCLAAVADAVDEMVIVDTGSTDRTVEIAESFGARVLHREWDGDFAAPRNVGFAAATCDWFLVLDADEVLAAGDAPKLRELLSHVWREAIFVVETNHTGALDDETAVVHDAMRLYRNRPEYRYSGRLHEQMGGLPENQPERLEVSTVGIDHYGYLDAVRVEKDKQHRNLELLERQSEEGEDSPFHSFNLGSEQMAMGKPAAAAEHFERSWADLREINGHGMIGYVPLLAARLVNTLRLAGEGERADERAVEVLQLYPDYTDIVLERGFVARDRGDLVTAEDRFRTCLEMGDAPSRYSPTVGAGSFQAARALAEILMASDERAAHDEAQELLEQAVARAPGQPETVADLARVMLRRGVSAAAALDRIGVLAPTASPKIRLKVAQVLLGRGAIVEAEVELRDLLALDAPTTVDEARLALVESLLLQNRLDEAAAEGLLVRPGATTERAVLSNAAFATIATGAPAAAVLDRAAALLPAHEHQVLVAWAGGDAVLQAEAAPFTATLLNALARLERFEAFERLAAVFERLGLPWRERREGMAQLYLRSGFLESAADEWMAVIREQGPDAEAFRGLAAVAVELGQEQDAVDFTAEAERLAA